jgi:hypothetical protein
MSGNRTATIVVVLAATVTGTYAWWAAQSLALGLVMFAIGLVEGAAVMWMVRRVAARWRRRREQPRPIPGSAKRRQILPRFKNLMLPARRRPGIDDWVPSGWDLPDHEKAFRHNK